MLKKMKLTNKKMKNKLLLNKKKSKKQRKDIILKY